MATETFSASITGTPLGDFFATVEVDIAARRVVSATFTGSRPYVDSGTTMGVDVAYSTIDGDAAGNHSLIAYDPGPGPYPPSVAYSATLPAPYDLDPTYPVWDIRILAAGWSAAPGDPSRAYHNYRSEALAPPANRWAPSLYPVGTVVAEGDVTPTGEAGVVHVKVETMVGVNGTVGFDLLPIFTLKSGTLTAGRNIVMDIQTFQGDWIQKWRSARRVPTTLYETSYSFPESEIVAGRDATWQRARAATLGAGTPSGSCEGTVTMADGPGTQYVPMVPRMVGFRFEGDPVGTYFSTLSVLDVYPYNDGTLSHNMLVGLEVQVDQIPAGVKEVTGDNPGVSTPGGPTVGVTPTPGGVTVTPPNGTPVFVPLPGGTPNGPITLRIDHGTLVVIYGGKVIYLYTLSPSDYSALTGSTSYVGLWDGSTVTAGPGYPAVYPPLGGWKYALKATIRVPLAPKPRLWWAWAHREDGLSVLVHDDGKVEFVTGVTREDELDPTVMVFRGGWTYEIDAPTATLIAAAGGLKFLTEVLPPSP